MGISLTSIRTAAFAATLTATALLNPAIAGSPENATKVLMAKFEPRQVVQLEVSDFHFKPGQIAPVHTHAAPAVGYVAKGMIVYQVEGEKPKILREGDAFFEPTGQRILRFDNASATEEAIFIDFNLEQADEPFIVFEAKPTEAIDRRNLPTISVDAKTVNGVDVYTRNLAGGAVLATENNGVTLGLVAQGVVEIRIQGKAAQRIIAGRSFSLPQDGKPASIINLSSETPAKLVTFHLNQAFES
ncbi:MAG: cupin domain-containing protein [Alphaproteobacteria bacterium]